MLRFITQIIDFQLKNKYLTGAIGIYIYKDKGGKGKGLLNPRVEKNEMLDIYLTWHLKNIIIKYKRIESCTVLFTCTISFFFIIYVDLTQGNSHCKHELVNIQRILGAR